MKKILAGVLALSMVLVMSSCGKDEKSSKDSKETTAVTTTAETEETTEESSESDGSSAAASGDSSSESKIDPADLKYDFKGIASEKYITAFSSGKYMLKYSIPDYGMSQTVYLDGENEYMSMEMSGMNYSMLYLDKVQYMLGDNQYAKMESGESSIPGLGVADMFSDFGLYKSGEEDVDGKTYKYDEYYQEATGQTIKLLVSDNGDLYALGVEGMYMIVEEFNDDFDSSKIMAIPEGAKEVSAEELQKSLSGGIAGGDAAEGDLSSDSSSSASDSSSKAD